MRWQREHVDGAALLHLLLVLRLHRRELVGDAVELGERILRAEILAQQGRRPAVHHRRHVAPVRPLPLLAAFASHLVGHCADFCDMQPGFFCA